MPAPRPLLEKIRDKIVEEGDCWNWTGAVQTCGSVPTMNHKGKVGAVRRFILEDQGVELGKRLASYTCGNPQCVNPAHTAPISRRALQLRLVEEHGYASNPVRRKRLADNARKRAKITAEIAEQIRNGEGTQRERAERFGVSQSVVSRIVLGKGWRTYGGNPFAGLGARV
jgi:hypothetical protein